jgi:hypothetical protein
VVYLYIYFGGFIYLFVIFDRSAAIRGVRCAGLSFFVLFMVFIFYLFTNFWQGCGDTGSGGRVA